jgi:hypothetical protein
MRAKIRDNNGNKRVLSITSVIKTDTTVYLKDAEGNTWSQEICDSDFVSDTVKKMRYELMNDHIDQLLRNGFTDFFNSFRLCNDVEI